MATVTLKGNPFHTNKELPAVGSKAPDFSLVDKELKDVSLKQFSGKKKLLYVVPSLDTEVCSLSTKKFNETAKSHPNVVFITASCDLPFAQSRFCQASSVQNVHTLSMMRSKKFAEDYGLLMVDGPLQGLTARAVFVLDENDKIVHVELVPEIASEPNYTQAFSKLS